MNVKNRTCECLVLGNFYRSSTYRKARCKLKKKKKTKSTVLQQAEAKDNTWNIVANPDLRLRQFWMLNFC